MPPKIQSKAAKSPTPSRPEFKPVADPAATIVFGNARFTLLTPFLVRLEWSATKTFEDRASFAFTHRLQPVPEHRVRRGKGEIVIETQGLTLTYRDTPKGFTAQTLSIALKTMEEKVLWTPGTKDKGNLRGTTRTLDMVSGAAPLEPGLLSRDGWSLYDDSGKIVFDGSDWPWAVHRADRKAIDWYFFGYGRNYRLALQDFMKVAGRIPLPPRYVFGSWWSRYWPYTDKEFQALVAEHDAHDVPLDVLVIDMDWHLPGWTGYTWDPQYFPNPDKFLQWCQKRGLRTTLNLHPADGVGKHEAQFTRMAQAMGLDPATVDRVPFDCTSRRYMDAYFDILHHPEEKRGVDFWWLDWQQGSVSGMEGLDPLPWLNYLHWTDMERNRERASRYRPLAMSRWGGLGNHRYPLGFSGDTYCNWESLAFQPYFTSTSANVGFIYWSHDIGGHQPGRCEPELYARWVQWGALNPVLRVHSTRNPEAERRIWTFPPDVYDSAKKAFHLRTSLVPYLYTAARLAHDEALALCRPLYHDWPELSAAYDATDEYMLGPDLLAAPVISPGNPRSRCALRTVWLPPGEWIDFYSGEVHSGPTTIERLVPLDEIPLYVRAGAILPMTSSRRAEDVAPAAMQLHVWPGVRGTTRVYEDDGLSHGYLGKDFAWIPVSQHATELERVVTIGRIEGAWPGMPAARPYELHFRDIGAVASVLVDGEPLPRSRSAKGTGWSYDPATLTLRVRTAAVGARDSAEVRVLLAAPGADAVGAHRGAGVHSLAGVRGVRARVARIRTALGAAAPALLAQADQHTGDAAWLANAVDAILGCKAPAEAKFVSLAHLLGLNCDLRVKAARGAKKKGAAAAGVVDVEISARILRGFSGLEVEAKLLLPGGWKRTDKAMWRAAKLKPGAAARFVAGVQAPVNESRTSTLRAELEFRVAGRSLRIALDRTVLPSINCWHILGPFENPGGHELDLAYPPEKKIDLKAEYVGKGGRKIRWQKAVRTLADVKSLDSEFFIELNEYYGKHYENAVAYAFCWVHSPRAMDAVLALGSDDGCAAWVNGREVHRNPVGRAFNSRQDRVPIRLKKGANALLLKISQAGFTWSFAAHIESPDGETLQDVSAALEQ